MAELASIPADRLMPASVDPGPAGYPPVKVRAAAADLLPARSLYHQETQSLVRDFLTYDEIPGVTNCSTANLPAGFRIERHVHPSKVSPFFRILARVLELTTWPHNPDVTVRDFPGWRGKGVFRYGRRERARATSRARFSS